MKKALEKRCTDVDTLLLIVLLASLSVPLNFRLGGLFTVYTFDIALSLVYGVWLVQLVCGLVLRPRLQALDIAALAMLAWFALSAVMSRNPLVAIDGVFFHLRTYLIYFYVANSLRTARQAQKFVALLLALVALEGVVSTIQYVSKTNFGTISDLVGKQVAQVRVAPGKDLGLSLLLFRARGTLGYDTALGHWFELLLPVAVSLWLLNGKPRQQIGGAGVIALGFVGLIFSFARGAWMGFALAMAVLFVLLWRKMGFTRRYWLAVGKAAALFGILSLLLWIPIQARLFSQEAIDRSAVFRAQLNEIASQLLQREPIFGVGLGLFRERAQGEGIQLPAAGQRAHNIYLAVASEAGLPGLVAFLIFLAVAGRTFYEAGKAGFGAQEPGEGC